MLARQARHDAVHVFERELPVRGWCQHTAPGVEEHDRLRTRGDLGIEVGAGRVGEDREQSAEFARLAVQEALDRPEGLAAAALDHVGRHRPRAARKADQGYAAAELAPHEPHRVHDVAQLALRVGHAEPSDVGRGLYRTRDARSLARFELETEVHRVRDRQDVREEDRGVEAETCERLQRHLAGELGCRAERKKAPGAFARRAVLGEIATCLPHHPDRRPGCRLAQQRAQQQVVGERGAHAVGRPKTPAIVSWIDSAAARGSAASRIGRPTTM